jgi:hypothetical protein
MSDFQRQVISDVFCRLTPIYNLITDHVFFLINCILTRNRKFRGEHLEHLTDPLRQILPVEQRNAIVVAEVDIMGRNAK